MEHKSTSNLHPNPRLSSKSRFSRTNCKIHSQFHGIKDESTIKYQNNKLHVKINQLTKQLETTKALYGQTDDKYSTYYQKYNLYKQKLSQQIDKNENLYKIINILIHRITIINTKIKKTSNYQNIPQISTNIQDYLLPDNLYQTTNKLIHLLEKNIIQISQENQQLPKLYLEIDKLKWENKLQLLEIKSLNNQIQIIKNQYNQKRSKSKSFDKIQTIKSYTYIYSKLQPTSQQPIKESTQDEYVLGGFKKIRKKMQTERQQVDQKYKQPNINSINYNNNQLS